MIKQDYKIKKVFEWIMNKIKGKLAKLQYYQGKKSLKKVMKLLKRKNLGESLVCHQKMFIFNSS